MAGPPSRLEPASRCASAPPAGEYVAPAVLKAELDRARSHYNAVRLHDAVGYVTPNDEHEGRGDMIRQHRQDGLHAADTARRAHHRATPTPHLP